MYKFAHFSDIHLGGFKGKLRDLVLEAFLNSLDICIKEQVDFIVIAGDLFDSNLPDMSIVNKAVKKMVEVKQKGIEIYVIYGSHDFSPNQSSIIDILASAGLFVKLTGSIVDQNLILDFNIDKKTNAKIVGISGLKLGLDKEFFEILNRHLLEEEEGFKIFVFHGMIDIFKPSDLFQIESIPISYFPKNFNYYAGGHVHKKTIENYKEFKNVVYPGPLFGSSLKDIEQNSKKEKRGFYIVSFLNDVNKIDFVEVSPCKYLLIEFDANNKRSEDAYKDLKQKVEHSDPDGKIVILKVTGELAVGKTSDLHLYEMVKILKELGAIDVFMGTGQLKSKEYDNIKITTYDSSEIERKIFSESIGSLKLPSKKLLSNSGIQLSVDLLRCLKNEKKHNEKIEVYESRIINDAIETIQLKKKLEEI